MSTRDELARDLFLADNSSFPEGAAEKDWDENREHHDYAYAIADGLIAKGYRKPRTITTARDLEALTPGTRFLSHGILYTRVGPSSRVRSEFGVEMYLSEFNYSGFTATVLHEPGATR